LQKQLEPAFIKNKVKELNQEKEKLEKKL